MIKQEVERIYHCLRCDRSDGCPRGGCELALTGVNIVTTKTILFDKKVLKELEDYKNDNSPFKDTFIVDNEKIKEYNNHISDYIDEMILDLITNNS